MLQKNKKLSSLVRLLASLCLIGGLTAATGCLGGDGGGNNGNNGSDCASGEIDYNGQCYNECASAAECNSGESCTPIGDSGDSVCIETSTEDTGTNTDTGTDTGTDAGGCASGEIEVAGTCLTSCSSAGDCGDSEVCETVTQSGDMACLYVVGTLGEACTGDGDCNAPDPNYSVNGSGRCLAEDTDDEGNTVLPGGLCTAAPCDLQAQSLLTDGCGADGICLNLGSSSQPAPACLKLCSSNDECPRGDTTDYSCNILGAQQGQLFGVCLTGCASDADCVDAEGTQIGSCNDQNQCESFCDPSDQSGQRSCESTGGTCADDSDNPDNPDGGVCQF